MQSLFNYRNIPRLSILRNRWLAILLLFHLHFQNFTLNKLNNRRRIPPRFFGIWLQFAWCTNNKKTHLHFRKLWQVKGPLSRYSCFKIYLTNILYKQIRIYPNKFGFNSVYLMPNSNFSNPVPSKSTFVRPANVGLSYLECSGTPGY